MKTFNLASIALVSLSIGCTKAFSWDDLDNDLYVRELDAFDLEDRDLMDDFEPELLERDFMDEIEEELHTRQVSSKNQYILDHLSKAKKEMLALYKDMSKKVEEQKKKFPLTKDTGKAVEEELRKINDENTSIKSTVKKTAKKTDSKKKSSKKADVDDEDVEQDFDRRSTIDFMADGKPNFVLRCDLLVSSFKPDSQLVKTIEAAEQHLKWDQRQYLEWDLLTMQAYHMSWLKGGCQSAEIEGMNERINKVWGPFSTAVNNLARMAKKSKPPADETVLKLASQSVGSINWF